MHMPAVEEPSPSMLIPLTASHFSLTKWGGGWGREEGEGGEVRNPFDFRQFGNRLDRCCAAPRILR